MVQTIERAPSFGTQLAQTLGQAAGNIGQGFIQRRNNQADDRILSEFGNNPNLTPLQQIQSFAKLSKDKQQSLSPLLGQYIKTQGQQQVEGSKQQLKQQEEASKSSEEQKEWGQVFNTLDEGLPYVGSAIPFTKSMLAHFPWSKAAEQRELYDVTAFQLERYARGAHTKGTMSTQIYNSLLSKLPDSKLSEAANRGRIKGWKNALLDNSKTPEILDSNTPDQQKSEPNTPLKGREGFSFIIDPSDGQPVEIPNDQVKAAQAAGYKLK